MPYSARKHQLQQALVYHVYNRSNGRARIFHCDDDYRYFMELLAKYIVSLVPRFIIGALCRIIITSSYLLESYRIRL
jgi:hypothetical protein